MGTSQTEAEDIFPGRKECKVLIEQVLDSLAVIFVPYFKFLLQAVLSCAYPGPGAGFDCCIHPTVL